ncbi:MAG: MmgE/PrpD family protein [Rhodospirillales bacterium]|nr:MmgE/PrpD family protein [Rhodospirillales bacterium]
MTRIDAYAQRVTACDVAPDVRERLTIHLTDTVGAWLAGRATREGGVLARLWPSDGDRYADAAARAASTIRLTEIDDIHMETCITVSSVVVPAALAAAAAADSRPDDVAAGLAAGYGAALSLGRAIGGANILYSGVWPTLFCAPFGAAAAASRTMGLSLNVTAHALAIALAQSHGRSGGSFGATPARWMILGEAVATGYRAAIAASEGVTADLGLLDGDWLTRATGITEADSKRLDEIDDWPFLGGMTIKPFPVARQAANSYHAFCDLLADGIDPVEIERVLVQVPHAYSGMIGRPATAGVRLSAMTSVAFVIAAAALKPEVLDDLERRGQPEPQLAAFAEKVEIEGSDDLNALFPEKYPGRVTVWVNGKARTQTRTSIPGDPDTPLSFEAVAAKARRFFQATRKAEGERLITAAGAALSDAAALHEVLEIVDSGRARAQ